MLKRESGQLCKETPT